MAYTYRLHEEILAVVEKIETGKRSARNRRISTRYYGLDGRGGLAMEKIGDQWGLTRESVRQINDKFSKQLKLFLADIPSLQDACELITKNVPICESDLNDLFEDAELTPPGFKVRGIINLIKITGIKDYAFDVIKEKSAQFVLSGDAEQKVSQHQLVRRIMSQAIKDVSSSGAVHIPNLLDIVEGLDLAIREQTVKSVVGAMPGSRWIEGTQWAFFRNRGRNRILTRVDKIFSVVQEAHIKDVRQGLRNSLALKAKEKKNYPLLPKDLLVEMLEQTGRYKFLPGERLVCTAPKTAKKMLRLFEYEMARLLVNEKGHLLREKQMEDWLVKKDTKNADKDKYNFSMALNHSPLFIRKERGLYSLVGIPWPQLS